MLGISNLFGFLVASAAVICIPGPATFYVMGKTNNGFSRAVTSVASIMVGDLVLISLAGFGFAEFAKRYPTVLEIMKIFGAIYVGYLGINLVRSSKTNGHQSKASDVSGNDFIKGLFLTLTNPKPILFFVAFFPLFIAPSELPFIATFYALGGLFQLVSLVYFGLMIAACLWLRSVPIVDRFMRGGFNTFAGIMLIVMAIFVLSDFIIGV